VTPVRTAIETTEAWNVPVTSIRKPKTTGITSGPMLPREEMRPITPPTEAERRSCSAGAARLIVSTPIIVNPERKMHRSKIGKGA